MKAIIIGTTDCKFCKIAKQTAINNNIEYEYKVIDRGEPKEILLSFGEIISMDKAIELVGSPFRSVPQVIVDGKYIGGSDDFYNFVEKSKLDPSDFDDMNI